MATWAEMVASWRSAGSGPGSKVGLTLWMALVVSMLVWSVAAISAGIGEETLSTRSLWVLVSLIGLVASVRSPLPWLPRFMQVVWGFNLLLGIFRLYQLAGR